MKSLIADEKIRQSIEIGINVEEDIEKVLDFLRNTLIFFPYLGMRLDERLSPKLNEKLQKRLSKL
jgi:hypothetical protein